MYYDVTASNGVHYVYYKWCKPQIIEITHREKIAVPMYICKVVRLYQVVCMYDGIYVAIHRPHIHQSQSKSKD